MLGTPYQEVITVAQNPNNLQVLQDAKKLANDIHPLLQQLKEQREFRAQQQLFGSSTSVPANLMEFCAMDNKGSQTEKLKRCIAECNETEYWLKYCFDNGMLTPHQHQQLHDQNVSVRKRLFGLKKAVESK
jgi:four helix bundle protein